MPVRRARRTSAMPLHVNQTGDGEPFWRRGGQLPRPRAKGRPSGAAEQPREHPWQGDTWRPMPRSPVATQLRRAARWRRDRRRTTSTSLSPPKTLESPRRSPRPQPQTWRRAGRGRAARWEFMRDPRRPKLLRRRRVPPQIPRHRGGGPPATRRLPPARGKPPLSPPGPPRARGARPPSQKSSLSHANCPTLLPRGAKRARGNQGRGAWRKLAGLAGRVVGQWGGGGAGLCGECSRGPRGAAG